MNLRKSTRFSLHGCEFSLLVRLLQCNAKCKVILEGKYSSSIYRNNGGLSDSGDLLHNGDIEISHTGLRDIFANKRGQVDLRGHGHDTATAAAAAAATAHCHPFLSLFLLGTGAMNVLEPGTGTFLLLYIAAIPK